MLNFVIVKKAIVILLLVLYSASTIGATIHMHYCMNQFAGWSFKAAKKEKCAKCGMTNTGCCKDEKKEIKLSIDQQMASHQVLNHHYTIIKDPSSFLICNKDHFTFQNSKASKLRITYLHAPPLLLRQHTQATLSQFLI